MLSTALISKAVVSLILVICLILTSAYLLRAWRNYRSNLASGKMDLFKRFMPSAAAAQLEVLEIRPIDFKRKLALVRHGRKFHLLLCGEERDIVIETGTLDDSNGCDTNTNNT